MSMWARTVDDMGVRAVLSVLVVSGVVGGFLAALHHPIRDSVKRASASDEAMPLVPRSEGALGNWRARELDVGPRTPGFAQLDARSGLAGLALLGRENGPAGEFGRIVLRVELDGDCAAEAEGIAYSGGVYCWPFAGSATFRQQRSERDGGLEWTRWEIRSTVQCHGGGVEQEWPR